jgi:C1A family cysteine protease
MLFLVTFLVAVAVSMGEFDATFKVLPSSESEHAEAFEHLATLHGRKYESAEERATRFGIFKDNVQHIAQLREHEKRASFSPNLFFDLSREEFKAYRMKPKDILVESQKVHSVKNAKTGAVAVVPACLASNVEKKRAAQPPQHVVSALPKSFDWGAVKPPVVSPVKNQAQCGSCWAFSATETLESAWAIAGKGLPILAPQQIVDCSTTCSNEGNPPQPVCDQGCNGGWPWGAIATLMQEGGQDSEASYPYQGVDGQCAFNKANVKAVPKNYTCISGPNIASDNAMMAALVKYGPLSIAMDASEWQFYEAGIISQNFMCSQTSLDHAIQITAYEDRADLFGFTLPVWKVRNSWSSSWGYDGYLYIERGNNVCGISSAVMAVNV